MLKNKRVLTKEQLRKMELDRYLDRCEERRLKRERDESFSGFRSKEYYDVLYERFGTYQDE